MIIVLTCFCRAEEEDLDSPGGCRGKMRANRTVSAILEHHNDHSTRRFRLLEFNDTRYFIGSLAIPRSNVPEARALSGNRVGATDEADAPSRIRVLKQRLKQA